MREIKFKLFREGVIVGYEKHVMRLGQIHIFHSKLNDDVPGWEWCNIEILSDAFIMHDDKKQYINRKDKNGKEIYEGDIIEAEGYFYPSIVKYDSNYAQFLAEDINFLDAKCDREDLEWKVLE